MLTFFDRLVEVNFTSAAVRMLLELAVGFLLGMAASFFFYIPQLSGSIIDTQMGMTMNQMYDPGTSANMSVTGQTR
jgi:flagellar biosynthetic protein FliR